MKVTVIAEAGINHGGDLTKALKLADIAKECGADVVKYQTYNPEAVVRAESPDFTVLSELALTKSDFVKIAKHCEDIEIEFMSTPGDFQSLKFLIEELNVSRVKIGSDDLTNYPLLQAAAAYNRPIILSTGMATLDEIDEVMSIHLLLADVTLLHCVSVYPCPAHHANLGAIQTIKNRFECKVGYSDHTAKSFVVEAAVAAGASVVECHIMDGDGLEPIDALVSYHPRIFSSLVHKIRVLEGVLGDGIKKPKDREQAMIKLLRKSPDDWLRGLK